MKSKRVADARLWRLVGAISANPPQDEEDADSLFADFEHSLANDLLTV